MANTISINQFAQTPVRGQVESEQNVLTLTMQVSANQATALKAGDLVTLDTAVTKGPGQPLQIIAQGTAVGIGVIVHSAKKDSFSAGDMVEVLVWGVIWLLNTAVAIAPMAAVEDNGSGLVQAYASASQKKIGIAVDYVPASTLGRYFIFGPVTSAV